MARQIIDLTGKRFGRWLVLGRAPRPVGRKSSSAFWLCRCDCGVEKACHSIALRQGSSQSCGCLRLEQMQTRCITHGLSKGPEARAHHMMVQRCTNPNNTKFHMYGGRGVTVCDEWRGPGGLARFVEHIGRRPSMDHSIDRYPNMNGNYEPGNVRWATRKEQQRNRRACVYLTVAGSRVCATELAEMCGVGVGRVKTQMRRGLTGDQIVAHFAAAKR